MTREEAIRILDEVIPPPGHHTVDLDHLQIAQAWLCIKEMLTSNPVKHGWWIEEGFSIRCSECDGVWDNIWDFIYCPNCGARMDGGDND